MRTGLASWLLSMGNNTCCAFRAVLAVGLRGVGMRRLFSHPAGVGDRREPLFAQSVPGGRIDPNAFSRLVA